MLYTNSSRYTFNIDLSKTTIYCDFELVVILASNIISLLVPLIVAIKLTLGERLGRALVTFSFGFW